MRLNTPTRIFVHTTAADYNVIKKQFLAVNRWHKNRFGAYCRSSMGYYGGYTTLIEPNGKEYRYREDWEESCAIKGYNTTALHVALAFDGDKQLPTPPQVEKLRERLLKWSKKYNISTDKIEFIGPHRLVAAWKTCYGSLLSDDWAIKLLNEIAKDPEDQTKKEKTEKQKKISILRLILEVLKLKLAILLFQRKRQKTPPPISPNEIN